MQGLYQLFTDRIPEEQAMFLNAGRDIHNHFKTYKEIFIKELKKTTGVEKISIINDIEKAKLDISKGAWINLRDKSGLTALHCAVIEDNLEIIQLLINKGADINIRDLKRDQTPLHFAAKNGKKQAVELLLISGADPHKKDIIGKTAKQLTVNEEILDLFWRYGY